MTFIHEKNILAFLMSLQLLVNMDKTGTKFSQTTEKKNT